jgi:hypothetical protein
MAVELTTMGMEAIGATLLHVYNTGVYPGKLQSEKLHQVAVILTEIAQARHESDTSN